MHSCLLRTCALGAQQLAAASSVSATHLLLMRCLPSSPSRLPAGQQGAVVANPFTQPLGVTPGASGLNLATSTPQSIANPIEIDIPTYEKTGFSDFFGRR